MAKTKYHLEEATPTTQSVGPELKKKPCIGKVFEEGCNLVLIERNNQNSLEDQVKNYLKGQEYEQLNMVLTKSSPV